MEREEESKEVKRAEGVAGDGRKRKGRRTRTEKGEDSGRWRKLNM